MYNAMCKLVTVMYLGTYVAIVIRFFSLRWILLLTLSQCMATHVKNVVLSSWLLTILMYTENLFTWTSKLLSITYSQSEFLQKHFCSTKNWIKDTKEEPECKEQENCSTWRCSWRWYGPHCQQGWDVSQPTNSPTNTEYSLGSRRSLG